LPLDDGQPRRGRQPRAAHRRQRGDPPRPCCSSDEGECAWDGAMPTGRDGCWLAARCSLCHRTTASHQSLQVLLAARPVSAFSVNQPRTGTDLLFRTYHRWPTGAAAPLTATDQRRESRLAGQGSRLLSAPTRSSRWGS
jgi:hypothetical protein